ncbi:MAG: beta strand repeat-containing protein, partial [Caulobacteraceae bacterium]
TAPILPTGGKVAAGQAVVGAAGAAGLTINQASSKAIIDWTSFSIGQGSTVQINNGSGATLNRVTGESLSSINGLLSATGSVYLINPNGVIIGKTGVVNVGGTFVASTLDISNAAFLAGGDFTFAGSSNALVANYGQVGSLGGDVALIAAQVVNTGDISAANGTAGLISGYSVLMRDAALDDGKFSVLVGGAGTSVANGGTIAAANAELRAEGGNVYALAGDTAGVIRATGVKAADGHVWLVADGGSLTLAGVIDAEGANGAGGAVETSGQSVKVGAAQIDAHGGQWLLDPVDLTIDQTAATTLEAALNAGTSVTEQTTATGSSGAGTVNAAGAGDIIVAAPVSWSSNAALTLSAYRDIAINAALTSTGGGAVTLYADNTGTGAGTVSFGAGGLVSTAGAVNIYYDPAGNNSANVNLASYTTPTDYTANVVGGGALTSYMLVNTVYDLQNIENNLSGTYALGRDIDAGATAGWNNGEGFQPIAGYTQGLNSVFSGVFDGGGHTISDLVIDRPGQYAETGLFGAIGSSSTSSSNATAIVSDVNLTNASIIGGEYNTGALVGAVAAGGLVANISVTGSITGQSDVGSVAGSAASGITLSNLSSSANVSGSGTSSEVGGLIGAGAVDGGSFSGLVTVGAGAIDVGGLVGVGIVTNGQFTGALVAGDDATNVGGLVGNGSASDSSASGTTTVGQYAYAVGGAIGFDGVGDDAPAVLDNIGVVSNVTSSGAVTVGAYAIRVGGLIGDLERPMQYTPSAIISGETPPSIVAVMNSSSSGSVTVGIDSTDIGGLIGYANEPSSYTTPSPPMVIQDTSASGAVYAPGASSNVGGLVGLEGANTTISSSYAGGNVYDGVGSQNTGGLVGQMLPDDYYLDQRGPTIYTSPTTVTNSYATGNVTGDTFVGGLVGSNGSAPVGGGTISYSYASGKVAGLIDVGGFLGFNEYQDGNGFGGGNYQVNGSLISDYYDVTTTGQTSGVALGGTVTAVGGSTGLSPYAEVTYAGFDFSASGAWVIFEGSTRPILKSEASSTVTNAHQLQLLALDTGGTFTLANGVDLSVVTNPSDVWNPATGFVPIGTVSQPFTGSLNGQSNTISNLFIDLPDQEFTGLFGMVAPSAKLTNITLENVDVTGANHTGALAGFNQGLVDYDVAVGTVTGGYYTGGLLGSNEASGTVSNSAAAGATTGSNDVGGLVGVNAGTIANSNTYDATSASVAAAGGLIGLNLGSVNGVYAQAAVTAPSQAGGLIGVNEGDVSNAQATATASVTGTTSVGGLVGDNTGTINLAVSYGAVSSQSDPGGLVQTDTGGLVGTNDGGTISNSASASTVSGLNNVGGLVGASSGELDNTNTYATVTATGVNVGGLVGLNYGLITASYAQAPVQGASNVGGLVGWNFNGQVSQSYAIGLASGVDHVGGLIGRNQGGVDTVYATGGATGVNFVGGLAGSNEADQTISNASSSGVVTGSGIASGGLVGVNVGAITWAYSTAAVTGVTDVGGLVGEQPTAGSVFSSSVTQVYAAGPVTGQAAVGGLIGANSSTVTAGYFDEGTTGQSTEFGSDTGTASSPSAAVGGTTDRNVSAATSYPGFDFTSHWTAVANARPVLQSTPPF